MLIYVCADVDEITNFGSRMLLSYAGVDLDDQNGGIAANEFLETSKKNIFVAGDVASYPGTLGNRRLEHHDNAIITGKHAGDSMIGMYVFFHGIFVELTFFIFHCKINLFLQ